MFTGIVEEIGTIRSIQKNHLSSVLTIEANRVLLDVTNGDSIAVSGVCLTVSSFTLHTFTADVMHETLRRSSLGTLKIGAKVNLERAMPANGRFGGHIVTGHIDGTGIITQIKRDGNSICFTIRALEEIMKYIILKGSIAIDGISLTVSDLTKNSFSICMIPHTAKSTALINKKIGDSVNLENDCIGKYIGKLLGATDYQSGLTKELFTKLEY